MKKIFTLICLLGILQTAFSQNNSGIVKGRIIDSTLKQSLKDASITILNGSDSTLEVFTLAKENGIFQLNNVPFGKHILMVAFQGYENIFKQIEISETAKTLDLGNIYLQQRSNQLDSVVVKAPPIVVKKDTIDFNAGMFKTKPNASAEDLLKKLPGVEVDRDGNVKAQGQNVTRVLVDGKRFFGDDPKLATRNLPTDIIDKIQVIDAMSDQSAFSGFDDGEREKTINIITKKDRRKGYFGKASVGFGTDDRYDNSLNLSRFNGNRQLSLIAQGNNINKQNFSIQDILGSFGGANMGGGRGGGRTGGGGGNFGGIGAGAFRQIAGGLLNLSNGGNGIIETWAGGLNYRDVWSKNTEAYGSYFYNNTRVNREQISLTENILGGSSGSLFNNTNSELNNRNQNHRINFNIETKIDSLNSIIIRSNLSFQQSDNNNRSTTLGTQGKTVTVNNSDYKATSSNEGMNGDLNLLWRKRFLKRGRTLSTNISMSKNTNDGYGNSITEQITYRNNTPRYDTLNQRYDSESNGRNFSTNISYTEPIAKNQQIEISYNYSNNFTNSLRETYRFNKVTGLFDIRDSAQTNDFENTFESHRGALNYRYQKEKINFGFGAGVQFAELSSINKSQNTNIHQNFINFFPSANFNFAQSRSKNLRVNYRGSTNQPSATQLQPVFDISNPLSVRGGNPNLKQEFRHNFNVFYTSFDILTMRNFFASISASTTQNRIGNSTFIYLPGSTLPPGIPSNSIQPGATISIPTNLSGVFSTNGFVNFGFPLKKPKSNINLSTNFAYNQDPSIINSVKNYTRNFLIGQTISWTMNLKERFDFNLRTTSTYNQVRNTFNPQSNQNFFTQLFSIDFTYSTKSGWLLASDWDITMFAGRSDGFNQTVPIWTPSIAKQLFKDKSGEIKFSVFDVLNRNINIDRTVSESSIRDVQTVVLKRYAMLSFTYNLRKFSGPQPNQQNRMGAPGMNMFRMRNGGF